jgi:hypothetical protein
MGIVTRGAMDGDETNQSDQGVVHDLAGAKEVADGQGRGCIGAREYGSLARWLVGSLAC